MARTGPGQSVGLQPKVLGLLESSLWVVRSICSEEEMNAKRESTSSGCVSRAGM